MKYVTEITQYLRRLLTQPADELTRGRRFLRYSIELAEHCRRALRHDRAGEMAAALTYRTIFSLIPLCVMGLLVFRAFGGFQQVGGQIQDFIYHQFGITSLALPQETPPPPEPKPDHTAKPTAPTPAPSAATGVAPDASAPQPPPKEEANAEMRARIDSKLSDLVDKVAQMDVGSVGAVGLVVLIYAALALLMTVELNFNRIFNAPAKRSLVQQVIIYWSVITLGPVLLAVSIYLANRLAMALSFLGPFFTFLSHFAALAASWLFLFLLYLLMPNTKVRVRPALIGSFVAAVLWEVGKWGFKLYVTKAVPYSALYGTLGLIPLFLYWVYLTWLIVLFGLELTYTLQAMKGRDFKYEREDKAADQKTDPQWLVPVITRIGQAFAQGQSIGQHQVAEDLNLPARSVAELGQALVRAGLVHRVQDGDQDEVGYSLAMPPDRIAVSRVLELSRELTLPKDRNEKQPGWAYLDRLAQQQRQSVSDVTLASLINGKPGAGGAA
jgi:membrane protein